MRFVPETFNRMDWPRLVAQAIRALINDGAEKADQIAALQAETNWSALADYADDAAAASGGVAVGELYRTGSIIKLRVS